MQHVCTWTILDFRFRLTLTLKNNAACLYIGDEQFRLMIQADVNSKKQCQHVCTWVRNDIRLKVQADINSKTKLACVYMGDERF